MSEAINSPEQGAQEQIINITPDAAPEIARLISEDQNEGVFLRPGVAAGGCSGMSYSMEFDTKAGEFDRVFDREGFQVHVDLKALRYIRDCTLDYKSGMLGGGFQFSNPNTRRSCGCGDIIPPRGPLWSLPPGWPVSPAR
ncbi:MAG: iron-sulfur cluster assembly accessory protein [bacterium]|nr:iron-sulfur cluster assembly accessory protein [bacterium]